MARPVHEVLPHVGVGLDQAEVAEALGDDAGRRRAGGGERGARPRRGEGGVLGAEDEVVDGPLLRAEPAGDRHRPRDVGRVAVVLGAHVHHDEVAGRHPPPVRAVVEDRAVLAGPDDARVPLERRPAPREHVLGDRLRLVLVHPRLDGPDRLDVAGDGEVDGPAEQTPFVVRLHHPGGVERRFEEGAVGEPGEVGGAPGVPRGVVRGGGEGAHGVLEGGLGEVLRPEARAERLLEVREGGRVARRQERAHPVADVPVALLAERRDGPLERLPLGGEAARGPVGEREVEDPPAARGERGEDAVEPGVREGRVEAEFARGPLGPEPPALPDLRERVARRDEQEFADAPPAPGVEAARREQQDRLGLVGAGEVVQVRVRPVLVLHVVLARPLRVGEEHGDPVRREHREHERPARGVERRGQPVGVVADGRLGERRLGARGDGGAGEQGGEQGGAEARARGGRGGPAEERACVARSGLPKNDARGLPGKPRALGRTAARCGSGQNSSVPATAGVQSLPL